MRTLLLNPPTAFRGMHVSREQCGIGLVEERFLPSEMFLAAAYLRAAGHDVQAVDADQGAPDLSAFQAAVVWVGVLHTYERDLGWLRRAKESGCRTVMILNEPYGDFEAWTLREHPFIDAAVRLWERELGLDVLLRAWETGREPAEPGILQRAHGRIVDTGLRAPLRDLSHLRSCAELLRRQRLERYDAVGITPGRGCSAACRFCLYAETTRRKRPVIDVVDEMEAIASRVGKVLLLDPDLPSTRAWTEGFCRELIRRGVRVRWRCDLRPRDAEPGLLDLMRQAGCRQVMFAVETLDMGIREKVGAGVTASHLRTALQAIRHAGIQPIAFFYVGLPWDGPESLGAIERFLRTEPIASFHLKQVRPWPATPVGQAFRDLGLLKRPLTPKDFAFSDCPLCPTQHLTVDELLNWKRRLVRAGVLQAGYFWRFLRERRIRPRHFIHFVELLTGRKLIRKG
jgi:hypothetical protein